jgi:hypothetical protein
MVKESPGSKSDVGLPRRRKALALLAIAVGLTGIGLVVFQSREEPSISSQITSVTAPVVDKANPTSSPKSAIGGDSSPVGEGENEANGTEANGHPLDPVLQLAQDALVAMRRDIKDYKATLLKRERIGGKLGGESVMELKVINPREASEGQSAVAMHVYLKFLSPSMSKGREVIWIEGSNKNQIVAHEGGFKNLMTMNLDPEGTIAMLGNRYPITGIGMIRLVEKLIEKGERDREIGLCEVKVLDNQAVGDRDCKLIQVTHPEKKDGYDFHIAQIFFDTERMIPLRYAAYDWPASAGKEAPLEEEYTYTNVEINVGLKAEDFDPKNPSYNYP